jgi:hypothetical protein
MKVLPLKYKKRAIIWLVGPFIALVVILFLYAVLTFAAGASGVAVDGAMPVGAIIFNGMRIFLGLLGILSVISIIVSPFMILFNVLKREEIADTGFDPRSGKGNASEMPAELKGWSWGASGLGIVWGIYHSVWLSFIQFVPVISIIWWLVMGMMGNEWAWSSQPWHSVEEFKASQEKWNKWGLVFFVLGIFVAIAYICLLVIVGPEANTSGSL